MITITLSIFPREACRRRPCLQAGRYCNFLRSALRNPVVAFALLLCAAHLARGSLGRPISPYVLISDIGVVAPGQKIRRIINFRNQFRQPFMVRSVIASCGCTSAKLLTRPDSKIVPGSHCPLRVDIIARVWPGREDVEVTVVGTAGGSAKVLRYLFQYQVKNVVQFPGGSYDVDLGEVAESSLPRWRYFNVYRGDNPMPWDQMRCTSSDQSIEVRLGQRHQGDYRLGLHIARTSSLGVRSCILRFTFFDRGKKLSYHLERPVVFRVVGPVDLTPESILYGAVSPGRLVPKTIRLLATAKSHAATYRITNIRIPKGTPVAAEIESGGQAVRVILKTAQAPVCASGHVVIMISNGRNSYSFREDYLALVIAQIKKGPAAYERK
ncbi:MAG: DUF1573 domain-containing protein [Phycisphaerales bacterium]|nr:DUF1573 domain-containing protein [Phycisphaerales bacterium]